MHLITSHVRTLSPYEFQKCCAMFRFFFFVVFRNFLWAVFLWINFHSSLLLKQRQLFAYRRRRRMCECDTRIPRNTCGIEFLWQRYFYFCFAPLLIDGLNSNPRKIKKKKKKGGKKLCCDDCKHSSNSKWIEQMHWTTSVNKIRLVRGIHFEFCLKTKETHLCNHKRAVHWIITFSFHLLLRKPQSPRRLTVELAAGC